VVAQSSDILIRRATDADLPAVLSLLEASLGWVPDEMHERFFTWKHYDNPAGRSPSWVAVDPARGDRIVGFRTFLRWEFDWGGRVIRAVRAVDTATHPDYQGRGVFSRLTLAALDELRREDVAFVFNTPNELSRPGYLKMGWRVVGRLPPRLRLRTPGSLLRVARARTPADKWSLPAQFGVAALEAFADRDAVQQLLAAVSGPGALRTRRTPEFLAWRYGFEPLAYRVVVAGAVLSDGVVVLRVRRRGRATEAAIGDVLVPAEARARAGELVRRALHESGADYSLQLGPGSGIARLPGQGPTLVWRPLAQPDAPPRRQWELALGDVELF
jgi:GNAT superfamily N-acetyltransferase